MNTKLAYELYQKIIAKPTGAQVVKFDLHIHSPASKDFISAPNLEGDEQYLAILNEALACGLRIIAITDHNTFDGFNKIQHLLNDPINKTKYKNLTVLCGVEITCFSKHILAIFRPNFSKNEQNEFFERIGIPPRLRGKEDAMADTYGPRILIKMIDEFGGFSILAHADSKSGFFYSWCKKQNEVLDEIDFTGKSLSRIVQSNYLLAIQINSAYNSSIISNRLKNKDYLGTNKELPILKFSDSHGHVVNDVYYGKSGQRIGEIYSLIKLSIFTFDSIKMALKDAETRILECKKEYDYPQIIGCAIKSPVLNDINSEYCCFRFNPEMNCVIGSRGTGKSTLLEIIQATLMQKSNKNERNNVRGRYEEAIVFLAKENEVYAITSRPEALYDEYTRMAIYRDRHQIYQKDQNHFIVKRQSDDIDNLKFFLSKGYTQRQLYEYCLEPNKILDIIDDFIQWQYPNEFIKTTSQLNYNKSKIMEVIKKYERIPYSKTLAKYLQDEDLVKSIINNYKLVSKAMIKLHALREKMIKSLNSLLTGKVILYLGRKLNEVNYDKIVNDLPLSVTRKFGGYGEFRVKLEESMQKICELSQMEGSFDFFVKLLEGNIRSIIDKYKLKLDVAELENVRELITPDLLTIFLDSSISMNYNINTGLENLGEKYLVNTKLSLGQNAVALLLLVLNAAYDLGDNRPLIMDQPEDDLDNSYIYSALVKEFRKSKSKRQILISTHNPNIPVSADAENIMVLKYDGSHGYLAQSGSIDRPEVSELVMDILEGGKDAFDKRKSKYNKK